MCVLLREAYGEECFGKWTIQHWRKSFLNGRQETGGLPRIGQPHSWITEVNVNTVVAVLDEDYHLSLQQLEEVLHIPKTTIYRILKDELQIRCVCLSWLPYFLTRDQLQQRSDACNENLRFIVEYLDFLQKVITVDENWVHYHDPITIQESEDWKRSNKQKVRQQKSAGKVQLIAFFDHQ